MLTRNNSEEPGFRAKVSLDSPEYAERVATPIMNAVDAMPAPYRALVNQFGYIGVYHAWKRGWSVEQIRSRANGDSFPYGNI